MSKRNSEFAIIWRGISIGLGFMFVMGFAIGYDNAIAPGLLLLAALGSLWLSRD
jgi:heme/copper-type cytochrome/quinol oxidase subunit 3